MTDIQVHCLVCDFGEYERTEHPGVWRCPDCKDSQTGAGWIELGEMQHQLAELEDLYTAALIFERSADRMEFVKVIRQITKRRHLTEQRKDGAK